MDTTVGDVGAKVNQPPNPAQNHPNQMPAMNQQQTAQQQWNFNQMQNATGPNQQNAVTQAQPTFNAPPTSMHISIICSNYRIARN